MLFLKGILGGLVAVFLAWLLIVALEIWRLHSMAKEQGHTGLGAVAGGSAALLHTPVVVVFLTVSFGLGLYVTVR